MHSEIAQSRMRAGCNFKCDDGLRTTTEFKTVKCANFTYQPFLTPTNALAMSWTVKVQLLRAWWEISIATVRDFNTMFTLTFFHIHIRIPLPWWLLPVPMKIQLFKARWGCDASSYCSAPIAQLRRRTEWTYQEYQPNPLYPMPRPVLAPDEVICFFVHPAHHLHTTCTPHAPCWLVTWACIILHCNIIHL